MYQYHAPVPEGFVPKSGTSCLIGPCGVLFWSDECAATTSKFIEAKVPHDPPCDIIAPAECPRKTDPITVTPESPLPAPFDVTGPPLERVTSSKLLLSPMHSGCDVFMTPPEAQGALAPDVPVLQDPEHPMTL